MILLCLDQISFPVSSFSSFDAFRSWLLLQCSSLKSDFLCDDLVYTIAG